jgi:hypothetical protein
MHKKYNIMVLKSRNSEQFQVQVRICLRTVRSLHTNIWCVLM